MWYFYVLIAVVIAKLYFVYTTGKDNSHTCLLGKTAIITGANTGIGFETALEFAKRGGRVILACRNLETAGKAKNKIVYETDNKNVIVKHLDLSSFKSVQNFANDINKTEERIDILVNNAGGTGWGNILTEDNLPILMHTNHFGNVLLTLLLLDKIKQSAPSRIVNVASKAGKYYQLNLEDLTTYPTSPKMMVEWSLYSKSKLCNILFTISLAERLRGTQVTVNTLHPGPVNTEFGRRFPKLLSVIIRYIFGLFLKSPKEGAQTTIYVSLSKDVENITGCYFADCKRNELFKHVTKELAEELWKKTVAILKNRGYPVEDKI